MAQIRMLFSRFAVRAGQAALATVFLIGLFILLIALTLAYISMSATSSSYGVQAANRAQAISNAGVQEALLRLTRDSSFSGTFMLPVDGSSASVSVVNTISTDGRAIITASSTVGVNRRGLRVLVTVVSSTGQVNVNSWQQI